MSAPGTSRHFSAPRNWSLSGHSGRRIYRSGTHRKPFSLFVCSSVRWNCSSDLHHRARGRNFEGVGIVAGVLDLILIDQARVYRLELKADDGKLTPAQSETMAAMERAGATVAHAQGLDAALAQLEQWGLLRGRAV